MFLSLTQLVKLYILQKNHLSEPNNPVAKQLFEKEYQALLADVEISREDIMAPALFAGQPNIPFVLFKPKDADAATPRPLIIHTHGGPHVYMDKEKRHAEIAYFLSHGYVVACPNYRGSTGYPDIGDDKKGWLQWLEKSKGKHHIYGPQDVYTVAKMLQELPYIDRDKLFLRGGSFGSHINAHLLADIKLGKFENIFKGVHLSGGVKYPTPSTLPDDIPLLVTHSVKDAIAPYEDAQIFMEKLLLKQLASEMDDTSISQVQTYVASLGDHHLIDPKIKVDDDSSTSHQELVRYLELTTGFINTLRDGAPYKITASLEQYKLLIKATNDKDSSDDSINKRVHAYRIVQEQNALLDKEIVKHENPEMASEELDNKLNYGPSMALLKLQLGARFTGNIKQDVMEYLKNDFRPVAWTRGDNVDDAGGQILNDPEFVEQMTQMIRQEEAFLKQHPDYLVMYHAAGNTALQLYCFINLWQSILKGKPCTHLPVIEEMRLFDFMKQSFEDIAIFLIKMRRRKVTNDVFNNIPGFPERAIACNPALTSNSHSTASSSLWWYFTAAENERAPLQMVIEELFKVIGIYSPQRVARYLQLFEKETNYYEGAPQSVMQQVFVPYSIADKSAYLCQIWGEEFNENAMSLHSPQILQSLTRAPEQLEEKLRNNKQAFTNFGNCIGFGDTDTGFNYASTLQIRYLPRNNETVVTNSHFRNAQFQQKFVTALNHLIREDYADFLAHGKNVPDFIVNGTNKVKSSIYASSTLGMFKPKNKRNDEPFYLQQYELYRGLVQNPHKEIYGGIITLDGPRKAALQERLRKTTDEKESPHLVYPYSLCRYLKGYTYYDLLREAATVALLENDDILPQYKIFAKKTFKKLMEMIDTFSIPSSANDVTMHGNRYLDLYKLMHDKIGKHQYNRQLHQFIQPPGTPYYNQTLWGQELQTAMDCVLNPARLAKEKSYGHNIEERQLRLY